MPVHRYSHTQFYSGAKKQRSTVLFCSGSILMSTFTYYAHLILMRLKLESTGGLRKENSRKRRALRNITKRVHTHILFRKK
jgi:hypothetical protein